MSTGDIQIIDVDPITRKVTFVLKPAILTGLAKLVQIVVLSLLDVPGQDFLYPDQGGGMPTLLSQNVDLDDSSELIADIHRMVRKTEAEVIENQVGIQDSPEEKLRELKVLSVTQTDLDEVGIKIRIINEAGRATDVVM